MEKENYRCLLQLIFVAFIAISPIVSCSHSQNQSRILSDIETLVYSNPDSALALLNDIDVLELKADSLKAFYYLLTASALKAKESPMVSVFEIIDNLYSGFYTRLHDSYGDVLSDKEEQIIVLMMAGFIRKKLGVPEKEDIVEFVRHGQPD